MPARPFPSLLLAAVIAAGVLCQLSNAFQAPLSVSKPIVANLQLVRNVQPATLALKSSRNNRASLSLSMRAVDRRAFLAAAGAIVAGAAAETVSAAAPTKKCDPKTIEMLTAGLVKINGEAPFEDQTVAIITDGSEVCTAAIQAVDQLGAQKCEIASSCDRMKARGQYKEADCAAAIFSSEAKVKEFMAGAGLECKRCGFFGGPLPPKWIVVLNSKKGMTGAKIQEEAQLQGRTCEGDFCFQSGIQIPIYTLEELSKMV